MTHLIDKDDLISKIERIINGINLESIEDWRYRIQREHDIEVMKNIISIINTIEVKTDEENSLEKFKSLQHISGDLHRTLEDWGYAPNLYFFDGMWHVSWISCEEGDCIKDFEGNTPEEAIDKAYNWFHSTFCNS